MEFKAYDITYLEDVSDNLGSMLEYAIGFGYSPTLVWEMFVSSKVATEIERGNPKYLSGYSGREYLDIMLDESPIRRKKLSNRLWTGYYDIESNMYYWVGSALATFQYESGMSFYDINKYLPLEVMVELYQPLHEADIRKFIEIASQRVQAEKKDTNLKIIRRATGMTQQELSKQSQVDLRSIQMYEQRRNDINKAQAATLYKLAKTLGSTIEDLMENTDCLLTDELSSI